MKNSERQSIAMPGTPTMVVEKARVVSLFPMVSICLDTIFTEAHGAKIKKEGFAMKLNDVLARAEENPILRADLGSLKEFCVNPIHLARPSKSIVVTAETHDGYLKALREFWGYQAKYYEQDTLCDVFAVMDGPLLLRYIAFRKVQQENAVGTLKRMLAQLKAVMKWCTIVGLKDASVDEVKAATTLCEQVSTLSAQIGATAPIKQPVDIAQRALDGKTIEWAVLRTKTETFVADTLKAARALNTTQNTSAKDRLEVAFKLNTALFGLLFAGLLNIGPSRPFAIKALVILGAQGADEPHGPTDVVTQDCSVCSDVKCVGNVLKKIDDEEFRINSTHHKTAKKTGKVIPAISIKKATDPLAWGIVDEIFMWGHTALLDHYDPCSETSPADRRRAFRTLEKGRVYDVERGSETMHSLAVVRLVAELVGENKNTLHVTCNELRHMYAVWFRDRTRKAAAGGNATSRLTPAEEQGAVIAMGTSKRMWDEVYHDTHRQSLVDESRDAVRRQYTADTTDGRVRLLKTSDELLHACLISGSVILQPITHRLTE
jgi:hypothetical protein